MCNYKTKIAELEKTLEESVAKIAKLYDENYVLAEKNSELARENDMLKGKAEGLQYALNQLIKQKGHGYRM